MASSSTSRREDTHSTELFDEGHDIELHDYTFSLLFLESLVYYFLSFQINIDGGRLAL